MRINLTLNLLLLHTASTIHACNESNRTDDVLLQTKQNKKILPSPSPITMHVNMYTQIRTRAHVRMQTQSFSPLRQLNTSHRLRMLPRALDLAPTRPSLTMASAKARWKAAVLLASESTAGRVRPSA